MRKRCLQRGCQRLITTRSYCHEHTPYRNGWHALSAGILLRDDYLCQIKLRGCLGEATTVDHINGDASDNRSGNLRAACRPCNTAKGGVA